MWAEVNKRSFSLKKKKELGLKGEGDIRRAFNFKRQTNGKNNFVKPITAKI